MSSFLCVFVCASFIHSYQSAGVEVMAAEAKTVNRYMPWLDARR